MEQKRQYNLDLLRIVACFMVLILHVAAHHWNKTAPESTEWQIFNVYNVLVRSAVPLFFMISGKLFLSRDDISLKKLFFKNILRLVFVYILWSFLYAVDTIGIRSLVASPDISHLFSVAVTGKYHLWYLPALVSVYLLIPVFISMKSYKGGKILDYTVILFFAFAIVRYSVLLLPLPPSVKVLLRKFNFIFDTYCGYFLLGHILDKYLEKFKKIPSFILILVFLITVAATATRSYFLSVKAGMGVSTLYDNFFIATCIEAVMLFIVFLRLSWLNVNKTAGTIIKKVSAHTFFVYLFHPFLIEHLDLWFGLDSLSFAPVLSVPVIALLLFVLSVAIALILEKIPVVRNIFLP